MLGKSNILKQIIPRFVNIGVDLVGRNSRRFQGELDAYIPADLTYPDSSFTIYPRCFPQTQMVPLIDCPAGFLQGEVLCGRPNRYNELTGDVL